MQDRTYFGLTTMQIGILAGLVGVVCLLFGLMGWLIFRGGFSRAPAATPVIVSTSTPFAIPTITSTPTPTPIPYEQLIPEGWVQYRTALVELWLPSVFTTGDATLFEQSSVLAILEMALTGKATESSVYQMLVTVSYEPIVGSSLDAFLTNEIAKLPVEARMTERRSVSVNSTNAIRFLFEVRINNIDVNILSYAFLDGSTVWYVEYAAQINEFYEVLPAFEQSIKTFRIVQ